MFRDMRRKKQELSRRQCDEILYTGSHGVLALAGDEGWPYAVPMSYVYDGENIYFHCARSGHKIDAVKKCPRASFCVVARDDVVPEEYTTYFKSVIVFGETDIITSGREKYEAIKKLAQKYSPDESEESMAAAIEKDRGPMYILRLRPAHISGKQSIELVKAGRSCGGI